MRPVTRRQPGSPVILSRTRNLSVTIRSSRSGTSRPAGASGESFTAGKLGKYTVGADSAILLGPPFVFTKANVNSFNF